MQRDPRANDLVLGEEKAFVIRTLLFAFLLLSEEVALRSLLGVFSRLLLTLQFSASVPWRSGMRTCVTHGGVRSTGISSLYCTWCSEQLAPKSSTSSGRNTVNVPLLTCSLYFGFTHIPLLICFIHSTWT